MKVKDLIKPFNLNKFNIFVFILSATGFVIFGELIYLASESYLKQSSKLKAKILSQQVVKDIENIVYEQIETSISYNTFVSHYKQLDIEERRRVFGLSAVQMLENVNSIDGLSSVFDEHQIDAAAEKYVVYAERKSDGSITLSSSLNAEQMATMYPPDKVPKSVEIVGPYGWIEDSGDTLWCLTFWQGIFDNMGNKIGATYLDLFCNNYHKSVSKIADKYNCDIFVVQSKKNTYIYHPDIEKIGSEINRDNLFDNSVHKLFNKPAECSFDAINNNNKKNIFINIIPDKVPNTNLCHNFIVAFDYDTIMSNTEEFKMNVTLIILFSCILFVLFTSIFSKYLSKKFLDADVYIIENDYNL